MGVRALLYLHGCLGVVGRLAPFRLLLDQLFHVLRVAASQEFLPHMKKRQKASTRITCCARSVGMRKTGSRPGGNVIQDLVPSGVRNWSDLALQRRSGLF